MNFEEMMSAINNLWQIVGPIAKVIVIALAVWIIGNKLVKQLQKLLERVFEKSSVDKSVAKFLQSFISVLAKLMLILAVVQILGVPTTGLITLLGTLAMTVGLALQGSLSNFAGGILLLVFRPFKVGDYIVEDSHKNEGVVQSIDILYTKILTGDNKLVVVPNGVIANTSLTNVTAEKLRRVDVNVGISYNSDLHKAKEILTAIINKNERVLQNQPKEVFVKSLDDSCVLLETRVWVDGNEYWDTKWELLEQFKLEFDKAGIEIPFNQMDVHVKN